jgi:hypothetical protein
MLLYLWIIVPMFKGCTSLFEPIHITMKFPSHTLVDLNSLTVIETKVKLLDNPETYSGSITTVTDKL